jgi:hypothetical protein
MLLPDTAVSLARVRLELHHCVLAPPALDEGRNRLLPTIEVERAAYLAGAAYLGLEAVGVLLVRERPRPIPAVLSPANLPLAGVRAALHAASRSMRRSLSSDPSMGRVAGTTSVDGAWPSLRREKTHRSYASGVMR